MSAIAEMRRREHRIQRRFDRARWIGEEVRDACERFVCLGIEDMQDRANQERMTGLFPMIAALERPFGINENVRDILRVTYLAVAFADLKQRIIRRARGIGRIESEHGPELRTPAGGQLEILTLDVVDN